MVESLTQSAEKRSVVDVRERDVQAEALVAAGKCLADAQLCSPGVGRSSKHESSLGGRGPSGYTSLDLVASSPYATAADAVKAGALAGAAASTLEGANQSTSRDSMNHIKYIEAMSPGELAQVRAHEVLTAMANAGGLGDISRISSYGYHQVAPGESLKVGDVVQQKSQSYSNPEIIRSVEMAKEWDVKRQKGDVRAYSPDK
jgi:hypothetical protein